MYNRLLSKNGVILDSVSRQKVCLLRPYHSLKIFNMEGWSIASIYNLGAIFMLPRVVCIVYRPLYHTVYVYIPW